jgi:hypothetical protein
MFSANFCGVKYSDTGKRKTSFCVYSDLLFFLSFLQGYDPAAPIKKKHTGTGKAGAAKSARPMKAETATDMAAHVRNKTVDKLTVDVLKAWLKEAGIPISKKKKADLVQDVIDQFQS